MAQPAEKEDVREAKLFWNNKSQAVRIPADFQLEGTSVLIKREYGRLIIEPVKNKKTIAEVLANMEPLGPEDEFPDVKEGLIPAKDINL